MPQKVTIDGVEQEVFTSEEVTAQAEAKAKEASDAAVAAEQERLKDEHEADIAAREEASAADKVELEKLRKKDLNFEKLRNSKTLTPEQEAEAKRVADDLKKTNDRLDAIEKQPFETALSTFKNNNIGADKDLAEKFDFFFKKLSSGAKTLVEHETALTAAFLASTGGTRQPNTSSQMVRTSVDDGFGGEKGKTESQDSQNFGALLGLTPEQKKQFAPIAKGTVPMFYQTPQKEKNA